MVLAGGMVLQRNENVLKYASGGGESCGVVSETAERGNHGARAYYFLLGVDVIDVVDVIYVIYVVYVIYVIDVVYGGWGRGLRVK